jgi:hypothetical protein
MRPAPALAPAPTFAPGLPSSLVVRREDIAFENISPEQVRVEVIVTNDGDEPSGQAVAVVSAAVLGAFVPWRPLTALAVPPLEPGESTVVSAVVPAPAAAPLGPPDRVTPKQLLTALGLPDDASDRQRRRRVIAGLGNAMPADPLRALGLGGVHWAGNLNVFINNRPVERHMAQALRIYPGRTNAAMFFVGADRGGYRFELRGGGAGWEMSLQDMTNRRTLQPGETQVAPGALVPMPTNGLLMLCVKPPEDCEAGSVEVHVTKHARGEVAVVEFSLDPAAAGPGCFVV